MRTVFVLLCVSLVCSAHIRCTSTPLEKKEEKIPEKTAEKTAEQIPEKTAEKTAEKTSGWGAPREVRLACRSFEVDGKFTKKDGCVEWAGPGIPGRYGHVYVHYTKGTLYVLNDWIHRDTSPTPNDCYNLFEVICGPDGSQKVDIKVFPNRVEVTIDGRKYPHEAIGKSGFDVSFNSKKKHTIYEFSIKGLLQGMCRMRLKDPERSTRNCTDPKKSLLLEPTAIVMNLSDKGATVEKSTEPMVVKHLPLFAKAGKSLTLEGLQFGTARGKVLYGTTPLAIKSWSETSITVVMPDNLDGGYLVIESGDGKKSNRISITME